MNSHVVMTRRTDHWKEACDAGAKAAGMGLGLDAMPEYEHHFLSRQWELGHRRMQLAIKREYEAIQHDCRSYTEDVCRRRSGGLRCHHDNDATERTGDMDHYFRYSEPGNSIEQEAQFAFPVMNRCYTPTAFGARFTMFRGECLQLRIGNQMWMVDGPSEKIECLPVFREARGRVLLLGLGLGMVPLGLCARKFAEVDEIVIVEKNPEIIWMVKDQMFSMRRHFQRLLGRDLPTIRIHEQDAFDARFTPGYFDVIWADIWREKDPGNLPSYDRIAELASGWLKRGGWYGAWFEPAARKLAEDAQAFDVEDDDYSGSAWHHNMAAYNARPDLYGGTPGRPCTVFYPLEPEPEPLETTP